MLRCIYSHRHDAESGRIGKGKRTDRAPTNSTHPRRTSSGGEASAQVLQHVLGVNERQDLIAGHDALNGRRDGRPLAFEEAIALLAVQPHRSAGLAIPEVRYHLIPLMLIPALVDEIPDQDGEPDAFPASSEMT